ncbi:hypothetical protein [Nonomuraea sp. NPDC002799]
MRRVGAAWESGKTRTALLARKAQPENQLEYDRAQIAGATEAGEYVEWGKHNGHVGDVVHSWGLRVLRSSAKAAPGPYTFLLVCGPRDGPFRVLGVTCGATSDRPDAQPAH